MAKTLAQLVKEYLAQPLQDEFGYKDIPDVTSTTKKEEEEETKKPVIYVPPSGGGGGGGIGSLGGGDGTFIGGGKSLEDAGGTYPGGYQSAEGGFEFTGGDGEITADGPGYGTMGTTGYGGGQYLGGGEITADGPITGGINLNGYPGGTITGGTITGGINLNDYPGTGGTITGGINLNDYPGTGGTITGGTNLNDFDDDYSDDSYMAGDDSKASPTGSIFDSPVTGTTKPGEKGGTDNGPGGTHCCTAANERGDMTLTEVKKLRAWHRKQSKIWQRGYDVWGKVMADNFVSKYKWSSDRVRDFYNHKIYGKRTIGSTFADFCIYPMSMIIGSILTVMPPILGYQENKKHGKSSS